MQTEKFQNKFRIPSARLSWHDYSGGTYFVTICTREMTHYFGEITDGKMIFSEIGKYVDENLKSISKDYPYCEIPLYVVMPNHIHLLAFIDNNAPSLRSGRIIDEKMQRISQRKGLLSVMVGGFKSAVTRYANKQNIPFGWQTRFHEHIVRMQDELNRIADYIENNVYLWNTDCYNDI